MSNVYIQAALGLLAIIGAFVGLFLAVCVLLICYTHLVKVLDKRRERIEHKENELAARRLGYQLAKYAYWFSESRVTCEALRLCGIRLQEQAGFGDIDNLRETWRGVVKQLELLPKIHKVTPKRKEK